MATTYTANAKLAKPADGDTSWGDTLNNQLTSILDTIAPLSGLMVTFHEGFTSASLTVDIAAGSFITQDGTVHAYAGTSSYAIPTGTTKVLYLDGTSSWALTTGTSYPSTAHVRLATVVAGASTLTSVTDNRRVFQPSGFWFDGLVINVGTTTGLQLGSATSQKLGIFGATPIVQPSSANQAALTDSTGGTPSTTLAAVGATNTGDVSAAINNNFSSINVLLEALRTALVNLGAIKGSA